MGDGELNGPCSYDGYLEPQWFRHQTHGWVVIYGPFGSRKMYGLNWKLLDEEVVRGDEVFWRSQFSDDAPTWKNIQTKIIATHTPRAGGRLDLSERAFNLTMPTLPESNEDEQESPESVSALEGCAEPAPTSLTPGDSPQASEGDVGE